MADRETLEARFALRVASALDGLSLPHDIEERLRVARDQAVARARTARATGLANATPRDVIKVGGSAAAMRGGPDKTPWWIAPSVAALVMALIIGLYGIDYVHGQAQIEAAAEIDALLLSDTLPPKAYSDAGFREYLRTPQD